eukprot:s5808_g3.t4
MHTACQGHARQQDVENFKKRLHFIHVQLDQPETMSALDRRLRELAEGRPKEHRVFYLALPPFLFAQAVEHLRERCWSDTGWNRVVVEKPFGKNGGEAAALSSSPSLGSTWALQMSTPEAQRNASADEALFAALAKHPRHTLGVGSHPLPDRTRVEGLFDWDAVASELGGGRGSKDALDETFGAVKGKGQGRPGLLQTRVRRVGPKGLRDPLARSTGSRELEVDRTKAFTALPGVLDSVKARAEKLLESPALSESAFMKACCESDSLVWESCGPGPELLLEARRALAEFAMSPSTRAGRQGPLSQAFLQRYESSAQSDEAAQSKTQALGMHFDSRSANGEVVVGLSLGEDDGHIFFSRSGPAKGQPFPLSLAKDLEDRGEGILVQLPRRALYLFFGFARFHLRHGGRQASETCLKKYLDEKEIFRMDHYLAKTLVLNLLTLRFANRELGHLFHCHHVANVRITFKEAIGVQGRAGYFDGYGIIRDIMQNHLMQVLTLVAMEAPATLEAEDVRDEKVKVLKQIRPISPRDCVIGQYEGYQTDPDIQKINLKQGYASRCPTFAVAVLYLDNERWSGVPFIMKAGKGLEVQQTIVRIQFKKAPPSSLFGEQPQNELVIRIQPNEAIYYKMLAKMPGLTQQARDVEQTVLDLDLKKRFELRRTPEAALE